MDTQLHEIADGIYRISTYLTEVAAPAGCTVNQFLVMAEEPLLFHTGMRSTFPATAAAVAHVLPLADLRWVSFGHVEPDECGAVNLLLAAAPHAQVTFGGFPCRTWLDDLVDVADRRPRQLDGGEALDIGGRRLVAIPTPHAPHNTEAHVLYEQTTGTLFCGDLFTQTGPGPAITRSDLVAAALDTEARFSTAPPGSAVPTALRHLATYEPQTLAIMHGSSYEGDGASALSTLADQWEQRFDRTP